MSLLYPRLLAGQSKPLFDECRELPITDVSRRVNVSHPSAVYVATGGDRIGTEQLWALRESVVDLARQAGFPDESDRARNADFDLRLAELLHSQMNLVPAEAASRDLWAFLGLVLLPDVAFWRYPRPPRDRVLGTDLTRHVFGRLWWRAQLVYSPGATHPYEALGILGEAAFDQIYARRAALGGSPHLVKAILRVWNELDLKGLNQRETLQDFLKRLLRLAPFMLFDGIDEQALDTELRAAARESVAALLLERHGESPDSASVVEKRLATVFAHSAEDTAPRPNSDETPIEAVLSAVETVAVSAALSTHRAVATRTEPAARDLTSFEVCSGSGAQALGLEQAGFRPVLLVDRKAHACWTIEINRPEWKVVCGDLLHFDPADHPEVQSVDLFSAGLPRIKSAATTKRHDDEEERAVLRQAVALVQQILPRAVLLENLSELVEGDDFTNERAWMEAELRDSGYRVFWKVLDAADFGVPQHRRSGFLVALQEPYADRFVWPSRTVLRVPTVGETLGPSMAAGGWPGADRWVHGAWRPAPALVGGSDRRGGADLGPTGSKKAWLQLGVNGNSLADHLPDPDSSLTEPPKLTVAQTAMLQSIPSTWQIAGGKTAAYRQIGNALPPPLARAVGAAIAVSLAG
ncbi:DUF6339 family protein [Streptomyces sp. NPDC056105]|uniref:DNA cytosine methyltransferase n=1 Tax=Streptomyces sp. NPDC056105 TaxID=3345714 RepID=UPI0035DA6370